MEQEIWKTIQGYEDYQVSNLGNVKSLKRGKQRILKQAPQGNEYLIVQLFLNGKGKTITVHKLVAMAFLNHKPCGFTFSEFIFSGFKFSGFTFSGFTFSYK